MPREELSKIINAKPRNDVEKNALEVLSRLCQGKELGELDEFGIRRPIEANTINRLLGAIEGFKKQGYAVSMGLNLWLYAPWGGGKTETLNRLESKLLYDLEQSPKTKVLVIRLNLKNSGEIASKSGFISEVFKKATRTSSSPFLNETNEYARKIQEQSKIIEGVADNLISLGLDIGMALLNISIPGLGFGARLVRPLIARAHLSKSSLRKRLERRKIIGDDQRLLVDWLRFILLPSSETWEVFKKTYEDLANDNRLWSTLRSLLSASGYTTVVFLVDESHKLDTLRVLTEAFESLWDDPQSDNQKGVLNLCFVFASTTHMENFRDESKYGGFVRRFTGSLSNPAEEFILSQPVIHTAASSSDDLEKALWSIEQLSANLPSGIYSCPTDAQKQELREMLSGIPVDKITWHALWSAVGKVLFS